ncbi:MAG: hypothetical protein NTV07_01720 [Candidatus Omnitrophica bacterium]|nr:hypothetical protein [Candidatus Omnitrophota bacterium]
MLEYLDWVRIRVQGTDGIRGDKISDAQAQGSTEELKKLITPQNFKEYSYAYVRYLIETGRMKPGDEVVIGYDPRDPTGEYSRAVIEGAWLAGAKVVVTGICSTPGIPLYMMYRGAKGAIDITASHNPMDQIGIKLFLDIQGLKLFPEDEFELSAIFYKAHNEGFDPSIPKVGNSVAEGIVDASAEARKVIVETNLKPVNTWALDERGRPIDKPLKNHVIVLDCAAGSLSSIEAGGQQTPGFAKEVLEGLGARVYEVAPNKGDGRVNHMSGPAELEGKANAPITEKMVDDPNESIHNFPVLRELFKQGRLNRDKVLNGEVDVNGVCVDADGDRLFILQYVPGWTDPDGTEHEDHIAILSGDETAFLQAKYLRSDKCPWKDAYKGAIIAGTIESDFMTAFSGTELGLTAVQTGVGDKWILLRAALAWVEASINQIEKALPKRHDASFDERIAQLRKDLDSLKGDPKVSSAKITDIMNRLYALRDDAGINQVDIDKALCVIGAIAYAVGREESGHNITIRILETKDGRIIPVFFGDSLKSAVNTLVSIERLYPRQADEKASLSRLEEIRHPFKPGHKITLYAYEVNKDKLNDIKDPLQDLIKGMVKEKFGGMIDAIPQTIAEEPNVIYFRLFKKGRTKPEDQLGTIFVRNSGTEEKTSCYARGFPEMGQKLDDIVGEIRHFVSVNIKNRASPKARAERVILAHLLRKGLKREGANRSQLETVVRRAGLTFDEKGFTSLLKQLKNKEHVIGARSTDAGEEFIISDRGYRVAWEVFKIPGARKALSMREEEAAARAVLAGV